jgi:hypothetical protein
MADFPDFMEAFAVHHEVFDPTVRHTQVFAPCCRRKTAADSVVYLGELRTEIRAGNIMPKEDLDWACDACLNLLIADGANGWTWSNLYTALGAPDEVVRHELSLEVLKEAEQAASRQKEWLNPGEVYDSAYANLPADLTDDIATQRPDLEPSVLEPIKTPG